MDIFYCIFVQFMQFPTLYFSALQLLLCVVVSTNDVIVDTSVIIVVVQMFLILELEWQRNLAWRAVCGGTSRKDPGMPLGSSRLPGGLGVEGHPGRILGCPWDPQTAWRAGCGGHPGRILGCSCDTPDCLEGWVWGTSREDQL